MYTTLEWLTQLISFDTTSNVSNLALIECLANAFEDAKLPPILIRDTIQPKANLLATIPGYQGRLDGGIILSGHTDVVPVAGQVWSSDPFKALLKDDKIYGRGACDMKGFIAVIMALIQTLKARKFKYPIHFAFSYDEEVGCLGAIHLIEKLRALPYQPKACIVGEPTMMQPVIGHKGICTYRCQIHGVAAHSSLTPQGCNAIEHAATLISFLRGLANDFKADGIKDNAFDVPYTTISTNLIKGGNAENTVPSLCELMFEFRHLPNDKASEVHNKIVAFIDEILLPAMQKEHKQAHVILDTLAKVPGLETLPTEAIAQAALAACQAPNGTKVAFATEAGLYQKENIPTIVCGPGNIEQAHRANEYIALEQLDRCEKFIVNLLDSQAS